MKVLSTPSRITAVFAKEREGGYSVSVPALPGCFSEGDTFEQAQRNIRDAVRLYLADEPDLTFVDETVVGSVDLG